MTRTWSRNTAEKSDAQAHTSVSGRQLQHALASAVAAAGATLSAQRGARSWDHRELHGQVEGYEARFKASGRAVPAD